MSKHRVCPWWLGYLLASPIRHLWHDPREILPPYVHEGMTILEPGPGMGFFTLELLRLTSPSGRVIVVELQPRMLTVLKHRAAKAGLLDRLDARLALPDSLGLTGLDGAVDFALVFAVAHELPEAGPFFAEISRALKPQGHLLLAEPVGHVKLAEFEVQLRHAASAGLVPVQRPRIRRSFTALLKKIS